MVLDTNRRKETNRACYSIFQQSLVVGEGEVVKVPLQPAVHTLDELEAVLVSVEKNIIKIFDKMKKYLKIREIYLRI